MRQPGELRVAQNGRDAAGAEQGTTVRLRTALREFLIYAGSRYAVETQKQYTRNLLCFAHWIEGRPPGERIWNLDQITAAVVTEYQRFLNTSLHEQEGRSFTQPEKETKLYTLKAFLGFWFRKGLLPEDLRRFIFVPQRERKVSRRLLTAGEMEKFLEAPNEHRTIGIRDRAMLELAYSGLRAGELLSLVLEDVDLEENRVFIREAKGEKDRVVPMTGQARYWMSRWLARRAEFLHGTDTRLLFVSRKGRPICHRNFAVALKKYARRAQLPIPVSPHDLRRITATHLAANGAPLRFIQALLGHATLKVTTRYLRLTDEEIKKEYRRSHPSNRRDRHVLPVA